jgi:hypothetical protein
MGKGIFHSDSVHGILQFKKSQALFIEPAFLTTFLGLVMKTHCLFPMTLACKGSL